MVSVLDSGTVGPGFKLHPRRCWVTVLGKLLTPIVHQAAKLVAALLKVARVTAGLAAESNGSLLLGLWLTSPAGWLPRTGISCGTLCSVIKYGLPVPFPYANRLWLTRQLLNCWSFCCPGQRLVRVWSTVMNGAIRRSVTTEMTVLTATPGLNNSSTQRLVSQDTAVCSVIAAAAAAVVLVRNSESSKVTKIMIINHKLIICSSDIFPVTSDRRICGGSWSRVCHLPNSISALKETQCSVAKDGKSATGLHF